MTQIFDFPEKEELQYYDRSVEASGFSAEMLLASLMGNSAQGPLQ